MEHDGDDIGGILISSDDWKKIHDLEARTRAKVDELKINMWAIKKLLAADVGRLSAVGGGIKLALIAGAVVGALNTLAIMSGPISRSRRGAEPAVRPRRWRDIDDRRE